MQHTSATLFLLAACLAATGGLAGCSRRSADPAQQGRATAADAEWAWIQSTKKSVDARRAQLAQARAANTPELGALEREVASRAEELDRRIVGFINADPPAEGEKLAGRRLEAVRLKSDEDILLAHEFIEQGGDYRRAIEIYEAALAVDPDNPRLADELAAARARRYMTAERFAQVKKGMTQDEVRELLGQPNVRDVREFPERGITAWFYTRDADGRAAAVWFSRGSSRDLPAVYMADFHAVEAPGQGPVSPPAPPQI
jgi:outer membrane protein assembly factor BamE (lipoprotein component of BamABCDE complex)